MIDTKEHQNIVGKRNQKNLQLHGRKWIDTMKKVLIITPHFPPSNLAAVHRSRLFANHLPDFGWEPIILTVHEDYYEENLDRNLEKLLPADLRIEKVNAFPVTRPRIVGDIGLRAFFQLYNKARAIIIGDKIQFLYIPIPSFYGALLGRLLHRSTGIKYGIDYIDPWVHEFAGSDKMFSRHWLSTRVSGFLEPIAVKNVSLITGVAEGYYNGVIDRNPHLNGKVITGAMPYGGEATDHDKVKTMGLEPYLFRPNGKFQMVYAGAMLPKAYQPLEAIFKIISENRQNFNDLEIHFIGTGKRANDPQSFNIKPLAEKYNLWQNIVFEYPMRIPYLDVLVHLEACSGVFILGSTEPHYTPSKVYQGVLSGKPILAVLHSASQAVTVLQESGAGIVLPFEGEAEIEKIYSEFNEKYIEFRKFQLTFSPGNVNKNAFEQFSASNVTRQLAQYLDRASL